MFDFRWRMTYKLTVVSLLRVALFWELVLFTTLLLDLIRIWIFFYNYLLAGEVYLKKLTARQNRHAVYPSVLDVQESRNRFR